MAVRDTLVAPAARDRVRLQAEGAATARRAAAQALLGHVFARPELLDEALTHRSAAHRDRPAGGARRGGPRRGAGSNERMEFVGDRVLGLVVAEWLIERFPAEQEGELARRHAQLVSRPVLAAIAEANQVSGALSLAANELRAGVGQLANVLADAMEALIGALYLDAGLEAARRFVRAAWAGAMDDQVLPPTDPKTRLQEWLMARGLSLPTYTVLATSGPSHAPEFVISAAGAGLQGEGTGSSKREAERRAAAALLERLVS